MGKLITPVKVGLLVVLGVVAFFIFFTLVRSEISSSDVNEYWASFTDASGLAHKAEVRVAGVAVGAVDRIQLVNGKAHVFFTVRKDVLVYPNAIVSKRSTSLLGDNLIDLSPGTSQPIAEAPSKRGGYPHADARTIPPGSEPEMSQPLPPGSEVPTVHEAVSMDQIFDTLGEVAGDIQGVTRSVRDLLENEKGSIKAIIGNLADASATLDTTISRSSRQLDTVLSNAEVITADVRSITSEHRGDVGEIITNVRVISEQAREVVASIRDIIGSHEGELAEGANGIQGSLANLNRTLANLESITQRIDEGEGTLGKLISDKELGEKVDSALTGAADYVHRLNVLQAELLLRSEYLFRAEQAKNYVGLKLIPSPDKYFLIELVDDPLGYVKRETVIRTPPGQTESANQEIRTTSDVLKLSIEVAKRYDFATLRFGLIESTGGAGLDLHFFDDHLVFRLDLFDFANPEAAYPRVKIYANLVFLQHLFVSAGMDDLANPTAFDSVTGRMLAGRQALVGGGIFFTDEDLKVLFGSSPIP